MLITILPEIGRGEVKYASKPRKDFISKWHCGPDLGHYMISGSTTIRGITLISYLPLIGTKGHAGMLLSIMFLIPVICMCLAVEQLNIELTANNVHFASPQHLVSLLYIQKK
ncbi:hypothetical protein ACJX0J_005669 [Zea mays]